MGTRGQSPECTWERHGWCELIMCLQTQDCAIRDSWSLWSVHKPIDSLPGKFRQATDSVSKKQMDTMTPEVALSGLSEHPYIHKVHIHSHTTCDTHTDILMDISTVSLTIIQNQCLVLWPPQVSVRLSGFQHSSGVYIGKSQASLISFLLKCKPALIVSLRIPKYTGKSLLPISLPPPLPQDFSNCPGRFPPDHPLCQWSRQPCRGSQHPRFLPPPSQQCQEWAMCCMCTRRDCCLSPKAFKMEPSFQWKL